MIPPFTTDPSLPTMEWKTHSWIQPFRKKEEEEEEDTKKKVPSTKPCLYHTSTAHNQKGGRSLSELLFLSPSYEMLECPSQHLLCSYGCPYQKQEHLSNTKPPTIWYPLHLKQWFQAPVTSVHSSTNTRYYTSTISYLEEVSANCEKATKLKLRCSLPTRRLESPKSVKCLTQVRIKSMNA
jgi:hypothetical protein